MTEVPDVLTVRGRAGDLVHIDGWVVIGAAIVGGGVNIGVVRGEYG